MARVKFVEYDPDNGEITASAIVEKNEQPRIGFENYIICDENESLSGKKINNGELVDTVIEEVKKENVTAATSVIIKEKSYLVFHALYTLILVLFTFILYSKGIMKWGI